MTPMADVQINVDANDLGEVVTTLQAETELVTEALEGVISKYSLLISQDAKKNAPVDTGRLKTSIKTILEGLTAEILAGGQNTVGSTVEYAAAQEFGRADTALEGKKYMTRAYKKHRDDFKKEVRNILASLGQ